MNNNFKQLFTADFSSGIGIVDLKIIDIPYNNENQLQDDIKIKGPAQNNIFKPQMKSIQYEYEPREFPTVKNNVHNCFEVPNALTTQPDNMTKIVYENDKTDLSEIITISLNKMFPNYKKYLPDIFEIVKNITKNNTSLENQMEALIRLVTSLVIDKKSISKTDDEEENKKIVWQKICDFETIVFLKRDITTSLQKWLNAAQIDHALKKLCAEGFISKLKDNVTKKDGSKPGRPPSPKYKINNFGKEANHNNEGGIF